MPQNESPGVAAILAQLRHELRVQGVRVADLAARMHVAEPTLWRWLRGRGLTLDNLDRLCLAIGIDLRDLLARSADSGADRFTLAQERVLAADRSLALLFFLVLNGAQRAECQSTLGIDTAALDEAIERLRRLGLVDSLPGGRLRPLTSRAVRWRPGGPLDQAFNRVVKHFFLGPSLLEGDARYVSDMLWLGPNGRDRVQALFERLRDDAYLIARQEREAAADTGDWCALFLLVRPLQMARVTEDL